MRHFYFIENSTGEEFIVGANTLEEAKAYAADVADAIADAIGVNYGEERGLSYEYEMTEEEAEASGLDEY